MNALTVEILDSMTMIVGMLPCTPPLGMETW